MYHSALGSTVTYLVLEIPEPRPGLADAGGNPSANAASGTAPPTPSTDILAGNERPKHRARWPLVAGVAVVAVVLVVAYLLVVGVPGSSSSSHSNGTVLITYGTGLSLPIGQFNGINFVINSSSSISGSLNSSRGIEIYIMTPTQFAALVKNAAVSGYVWASGIVANQTIYDLHVTVAPGQWVLSFVNPFSYTPTAVGFYSDVTLTSA